MDIELDVKLKFHFPEHRKAEWEGDTEDVIIETLEAMVNHANLSVEDDDITVDLEEWHRANEPASTPKPLVNADLIAGAVVKLTRDVERYPSAFVKAGEQGIVTEATPDHVYVRLYNVYIGLSEWQNELHFYLEDPNHVHEAEGLEVIG